jgi:hypothetical protein
MLIEDNEQGRQAIEVGCFNPLMPVTAQQKCGQLFETDNKSFLHSHL